MRRFASLTLWIVSAAIAPLQSPTSSARSTYQLSIPFTPMPHDVVRGALRLAEVGNDDVVYDLGSGDGRVVIAAVRDHGARKAVGIEINSDLIRKSRENARKAGVSSRVKFIQGDLFTCDISEASVAVLYLGHQPNLELRARLVQSLRPGARIVSHQFGMGEWPPDKQLYMRNRQLGMTGFVSTEFGNDPRLPDYGSNIPPENRAAASMWVAPARVAGVWRGKRSPCRKVRRS